MNYFSKYGRKVEILETFTNSEDAYALEFYMIASLRALGVDLANISDGGYGPFGYKHSPEALRKLSESHKGIVQSPEWVAKRTSTQLGAVRSTASRERMSSGQKARVRTTEELSRMSAVSKCRVMTDEYREKLRDAAKRRWAKTRAEPILTED